METVTVKQPRPHEAFPELVEVIGMIEKHGCNPIWLAKLRNEIDAALATERNTSYHRGWEGQSETAVSHSEFCPREIRKDIGDAHKYPCTCGADVAPFPNPKTEAERMENLHSAIFDEQ